VIARPLNRQRPNAPTFEVCGVVVKIRADEQRCTGEVRWMGVGQLEQDYFDAADCTLVLRADGSRPTEDPWSAPSVATAEATA
jgi:hypothetical protein